MGNGELGMVKLEVSIQKPGLRRENADCGSSNITLYSEGMGDSWIRQNREHIQVFSFSKWMELIFSHFPIFSCSHRPSTSSGRSRARSRGRLMAIGC
jgi:hypothetical protein